jgi:hypothetical protein
MRTSRTRVTRIVANRVAANRVAATLVSAAFLVGVSVAPATAAPPPDDDHSAITYPHDYVYPPLSTYLKLDTTVPEFKLPGCSGLLSPNAATLFGASLSAVTPSDDGSYSPAISAIIAANDGTVCAWQVDKTKNVIQFSVTPISEYQRRLILDDWLTRHGTTGIGVGGRNVILTSGLVDTESAALLESGLYITATPVDGTLFPAFIQDQADHLYYLTH